MTLSATSSHKAAGSWFWRTVVQLAKGHRTFKHKLHLQFRFTRQPVFSVVFKWGDLKCHGRILGGLGCWWSLHVGSCAGCFSELFAGILLTQSRAVCLTQVTPVLHPQSSRNLSHNMKVLWDLCLSQASVSVQMMQKQKGKAAAGQGHQWGLMVESKFVQPCCWTRHFQTLQLQITLAGWTLAS